MLFRPNPNSSTKSESLLSPRSAAICHLYLHHITYLGIISSGDYLRVSIGLHAKTHLCQISPWPLKTIERNISAISCPVYQIFLLSMALAERQPNMHRYRGAIELFLVFFHSPPLAPPNFVSQLGYSHLMSTLGVISTPASTHIVTLGEPEVTLLDCSL
jgi:hypothetical protein